MQPALIITGTDPSNEIIYLLMRLGSRHLSLGGTGLHWPADWDPGTSRLEAPACIPCTQRYRENGSSDLQAKTHLVAVLFDTVHKGMLPSVWPRCVGAALLEGDPAHNRGSQAAMADMPCIE